MITPEFLQSCTDEHINKGVAWLVASNSDIHKLDFFMISKFQKHNVRLGCAVFNFEPCTSPNDAWPIIQSNRINLISPPEHRQYWKACATDGGGNWSLNDFTVSDKNPLRAAMEVYILMGTKS